MVGEYYCRIFDQIYHLPTISLRYFNVYGPRQRADSQYSAVIPRFVARLSHNLSPIIFGDGNQTRDFTFVADVVRANILAAEYARSGVYNIGAGQQTSINELARHIADILGKDIHPEFLEQRLGDVRDSFASVEAAKSFGYSPKYSLQQGLKITITGGSDAI
jgi:UDP-glucose 4-epimerase